MSHECIPLPSSESFALLSSPFDNPVTTPTTPPKGSLDGENAEKNTPITSCSLSSSSELEKDPQVDDSMESTISCKKEHHWFTRFCLWLFVLVSLVLFGGNSVVTLTLTLTLCLTQERMDIAGIMIWFLGLWIRSVIPLFRLEEDGLKILFWMGWWFFHIVIYLLFLVFCTTWVGCTSSSSFWFPIHWTTASTLFHHYNVIVASSLNQSVLFLPALQYDWLRCFGQTGILFQNAWLASLLSQSLLLFLSFFQHNNKKNPSLNDSINIQETTHDGNDKDDNHNHTHLNNMLNELLFCYDPPFPPQNNTMVDESSQDRLEEPLIQNIHSLFFLHTSKPTKRKIPKRQQWIWYEPLRIRNSNKNDDKEKDPSSFRKNSSSNTLRRQWMWYGMVHFSIVLLSFLARRVSYPYNNNMDVQQNVICVDTHYQSTDHPELLLPPVIQNQTMIFFSYQSFYVLSTTQQTVLDSNMRQLISNQHHPKMIGYGYSHQLELSNPQSNIYDMTHDYTIVSSSTSPSKTYSQHVTFPFLQDTIQPKPKKKQQSNRYNDNATDILVEVSISHDLLDESWIHSKTKFPRNNVDLLLQVGSPYNVILGDHAEELLRQRSIEIGIGILRCGSGSSAYYHPHDGSMTLLLALGKEKNIYEGPISIPKHRRVTLYSLWGNVLGAICLVITFYQLLYIACHHMVNNPTTIQESTNPETSIKDTSIII